MRINAFLGHEEVRRLGWTFNETLIHLIFGVQELPTESSAFRPPPGSPKKKAFKELTTIPGLGSVNLSPSSLRSSLY